MPIFRKPDFVPTEQDTKKIWGMNMLALQMNHCPPELRKKLPPSDSRLRPDMRAWEEAEHELAAKEKDRLENNQRIRRKKLKGLLPQLAVEGKVPEDYDEGDERTFHNARYFNKYLDG